MPSKKEVDEHNLTHVPYRVSPLREVRKAMEEDRRIREFSFDFCFLGDENGAKITVLVGRERVTGMTMSTVVLVEGTSGQFAAMKVLEFVKEPAIQALMADVVKTRGAAITVLENITSGQ